MIASVLNRLDGLILGMALKDRIREAFGKDARPSDIAKATGRSKGAVTQWLSGDIESLKGDTAAKMEAATGYRATWIVTGKGPKLVDQQAKPAARRSVFDTVTPDEEALLEDFRILPDEDQAELRAEIARRAEKAKAYFQKAIALAKERATLK